MNHLSVAEIMVVVVNIAMVTAAVVINWRASQHGVVRFRIVHAAVAALSGVYAVGYLFLLFGDVSIENWSSLFRGVSVIAWPIVWWWPALTSLRVHRELKEALFAHLEGEDSAP
jgi:uncharacterized membrane protein